jgi:hypothetical protein
MPKIYFTSGKTLEITEYEFERIAPKLQMGGIRLYRTGQGNLIPLNSTTMELIEKESTIDAFVEAVEEAEKLVEGAKDETVKETPEPTKAPEKEEKTVEEVEAPKKETQQERQDKMLAELIEKSNCLHPRDKLEMKYQETKAGKRYFPVCTFCGYRHRYISIKKVRQGMLEDWTMDDVITATEYIPVK